MNNLLELAQHIPVNPEVPVTSVHPVTLSAPDRGQNLELRIRVGLWNWSRSCRAVRDLPVEPGADHDGDKAHALPQEP